MPAPVCRWGILGAANIARKNWKAIRLAGNATLTAVALFLWRRSFIPPVLGMLLSVPLTELLPRLGVPALTAPFVLAAWIVLAFGHLDSRLFKDPPAAA